MRYALVVLSGGQDSSTCLAQALASGLYGGSVESPHRVRAITFDYGQRHLREVEAARAMVDMLHERFGLLVPHEIIRLPAGILAGTSPLVNKGISVERYADAASLPGGLERTFVPMRNALFLTIAANRACAMTPNGMRDEVDIITGVSQEDYGGYPDCREEFITSQEATIWQATKDSSLPLIRIVTPLIKLSKADTVKLAESLPRARLLNALSHTCYEGMSPPCGHCHACLLRQKGYEQAGVKDPLLLRLHDEGVVNW